MHTTYEAPVGTTIYGDGTSNGSMCHDYNDSYYGNVVGDGYNSFTYDDDDDGGGGGGGGGGDDDDDDDDPIPYYCTVYYWSLPGEPFNFPYSGWYGSGSGNCDWDVGWDRPAYVTIRSDIPVRIGYNFKGWSCSDGGTYWGG